VTTERAHLRPWHWVAVGAAATLAIGVGILASVVPFSTEKLREALVQTLSERFDGDAELADLHVGLFPRFHVEAFNLAIHHRRRRDVPPLISVKRISASSSLLALVRKHVELVELDGLDIEIPPDRESIDLAPDKPDDEAEVTTPPTTIAIDTLLSTDARLVIIPDDRKAAPKTWDIHTLRMHNVGPGRAMPFQAKLKNAIPPGEIDTSGSFGPWQAADPGSTPLGGAFTFERADLSVFKGISGILSARGAFKGALRRIDINGETETPQFMLAVGGHPVPLHAVYHAVVDGTNGDTRLEPVNATFLKTSVAASGKIVMTPELRGHTVSLSIQMTKARVEDVMRLAVATPKPPMTGALTLASKLVLPPGNRDVVDKMRLEGQFTIRSARFANLDIQQKVNELSHRSRGKAPDEQQVGVVSDFTGRFRMADGRLSLPGLTFAVPGSVVTLAGTYDLKPETLNFEGTLAMDASISETQRGIKRLLLKMVDPLFEKEGGGSAIPIVITGSVHNPSFGLDRSRIFKKK
jgi:hypothetical protein